MLGAAGRQVSKVDPGMPQEEAKAHLIDKIDTYIQARACCLACTPAHHHPILQLALRITAGCRVGAVGKGWFADEQLVANAVAKIDDGDVILTYACSSVVFDILLRAHRVSACLPLIIASWR